MKYWTLKQEWHFDLYKKGLILLSFPFFSCIILLTKEALFLFLHQQDNTESELNGFKTFLLFVKKEKKINSFFIFFYLFFLLTV